MTWNISNHVKGFLLYYVIMEKETKFYRYSIRWYYFLFKRMTVTRFYTSVRLLLGLLFVIEFFENNL